MLTFARTCRWRPLSRDIAARSVSAVAVRGNATIASCSSRGKETRPPQLALTAASTTAVAPQPQRYVCPCRASVRTTSVSQYGSGISDREGRRIRHISLWSGREQRTRSWGANSSSSEGEDDLSRLRRQGQEEDVLATLSGVVEPCTGKGVVELGLVQDVFVIGEVTTSTGRCERGTAVNDTRYHTSSLDRLS